MISQIVLWKFLFLVNCIVEISNSRDRVRYENIFLVVYSLISPQTTECINYLRLVQPLIYRGLRRSFLTVIWRSFLTGRGHIDSPRCQSVRRRTSISHTGYQRFPIPQVQVAPIVRKAYLTTVPQFIHSNQSSHVHLSLRGAPSKRFDFTNLWKLL